MLCFVVSIMDALYSFTMQACCYWFNHFVSLFVYLLYTQRYSKSSHASWGICATTCSTVKFNILCQITCVQLNWALEMNCFMFHISLCLVLMWWFEVKDTIFFEKIIWIGFKELRKKFFYFWRGGVIIVC